MHPSKEDNDERPIQHVEDTVMPDVASAASDTRGIEEDEEPTDLIQDGNWVIIRMPSGNTKLVQAKADALCKLGKFGQCRFSDLINKNAGVLYEIYDGNKLRKADDQFMSLDVYDMQSSEDANNREIHDVGAPGQKLSRDEIEALKKDSLKGNVSSQELIKTLVENSASFDKKTEFSKAKYIKKKQAKFTKAFIPTLPTARSLCDFFFEEDREKIRQIRVDTLSMVLNAANIHAGMRVIVADDAHGMLVAAVMERLGGYGTVFALHESDVPHYDIVSYCNFSAKISKPLHTLSWTKFNNVLLTEAEEEGVIASTPYNRSHKRQEALKVQRERLTLLRNGNFDALVVASAFSPVEVVKALLPYVAGSRPIVVYHSFKEALTDVWEYMRESDDFVNVDMSESWLREYQLPCYRAGTRPIMTGSSTGGFFVSATRAFGMLAVDGEKVGGGFGRPARRRW
ncbi:hypothetical protein SeMB42_g02812 [Synchytrium endobioticum]|uniref:tRNA (adenine(58)-N(1))-methyltransferase non-catalytic subunit TRM6 n=1 Tax=Synchytrium endobioticum TaxID=286115 RepID=A0A507DBB4_9FUNG|nr:hypothetical protein SeMB42_g02812 [Synchytrium endobioticum]TPX50558.1 hypothetical protein SeLEV6574_g00843 [Synchytrium endobioticum]